ncbi:MAG: preprotein translocase subunit SecG [Gaiellaceae bacterium]
MVALLAVFQVLLSAALITLILMHSGRDTGFGGMGFTPASQGGTHIVERNLTRLTVVVGTLFFLNSIALFQALE